MLRASFVPEVVGLCHEEAAAAGALCLLLTYVDLPRTNGCIVLAGWQHLFTGRLHLRACAISTSAALEADSLEGTSGALCADLLQLEAHVLVLGAQLLDEFHLPGHVPEATVFFLEHEQLLVNIQDAAFPVQVEDFFQVLDLALQLYDESIISGTHRVGLHFNHDLLCSVCELEGRDGLGGVVSHGVHRRNQRGPCVSTK